MPLYKHKLELLVLLGFCFCITICISSVNAVEPININIHTIGGVNFNFGDPITPSEANSLFFIFTSGDSLTYNCRILQIDEDLFDELKSASQFAVNDVNLVGTEISNDKCGVGNQGTITYSRTYADGFYAFEAIGTDTNGAGTKTPFIFQVVGEGAALLEGANIENLATLTEDKVKQFWTQCADPLPGNSNAAQINLQKIEYIMEGRSKIDNLIFDSNNLNLKVKTSTLNGRNELSGQFTSASSEDFTIKNIDTHCIYNLPEKAGQLLVPGPTKAFNPATMAAWNPPVPQCSNDKQFKREITYPFKVTSNLAELKDTGKRNVEIVISVDNSPKPAPDHNGIDVRGELTLDGNKKINLEVEGEPKVACSGETIVN